jgi:site-specific recombinase XerC
MEATTTTIVTSDTASLATIAPELETARAFAAESKARRTREAYRYQWGTFADWCAGRGVEALPADPATLAAYLANRAELGWRPASIALALTAIGAAHKAGGMVSPASHPAVAATWAGIRRTVGTAQRRAAPATVEAVRAMVGASNSASLGALRDRALLLVGFAGAFRRSELAALDVADLSFRAEGLVVTVRRSKTDQEGRAPRLRSRSGPTPRRARSAPCVRGSRRAPFARAPRSAPSIGTATWASGSPGPRSLAS